MKYLLIIFLTHIISFAQTNPDANGIINDAEMMETVNLLCSDEFSGRLPGHEGYNKAAEFMSGEFEKLGLKKVNNSYFQKLFVETNYISKAEFSSFNSKGIEKRYILGKDFVCRGFSGSGKVNSEIVFCGYGLDEEFYSDYAGTDVSEKIVMIFKSNPSWKPGENTWPNGYPRAKSNYAARNGAAAVIFVSLPNDKNPQKPVASVLHGEGIQELNIPQIHVELDVAEELLKSSGYTLSQLQSIIDSTKKPFSLGTGIQGSLFVEADYKKEAETMNVIGLLEGSDPDFRNNFIIIGGHLDHVGKQGDIIFPGANDNASGSAGVLQIARAFIKNDIRPRMSILFVLFASEEQGLFGAQYLADNLPFAKEDAVAMFNLDCIGYGDSIQVGNGKTVPGLWNLARQIDSHNDRFMVENTWQGGGADATPFHNAGIPALYFVSTNSYENIHTVKDTAESLNPELMEKITRLAYLTAVKLASGTEKPVIEK